MTSHAAVLTVHDRPLSRALGRLVNLLAVLTVATSFVVIVEPAPCDFLFVITFGVALVAGRFHPDLRRWPAAAVGLALFLGGNVVSMGFVEKPADALQFVSVTLYLILWWALLVGLIGREGSRAVGPAGTGLLLRRPGGRGSRSSGPGRGPSRRAVLPRQPRPADPQHLQGPQRLRPVPGRSPAAVPRPADRAPDPGPAGTGSRQRPGAGRPVRLLPGRLRPISCSPWPSSPACTCWWPPITPRGCG